MTDVHLSRVIEWALRRLGAALGWSLLAAFLCGVIAAITQQVEVLYLAGIAAPLAIVLTLTNSRAPMPYTAEELEDETEGTA